MLGYCSPPFLFVILREFKCMCVLTVRRIVCAQSSKSPRPWDWEAGTCRHVLCHTCSCSRMPGLNLSHFHPIFLPINIWLLLNPIKRWIHRTEACSVARMTMFECICIMYERQPPQKKSPSLQHTLPLLFVSAHCTQWHTNQLEYNQSVSIFH